MKLFTIFATILPLFSFAEVKLPVIFSDHMVLQRSVEVPIWGRASPNEKVTVSFAGKSVSAVADSKGEWMVKLPELDADKSPRDLNVRGSNEIIFKNVLVGDVWICSGQSNMEWPLSKCTKDPKKVAANHKDNKQLRLFRIPAHLKAKEPQSDTQGTWMTCENSQELMKFSGCGFFFGSKLERELEVPIGLIDTSWGGTRIDEWISNDAFAKYLKGMKKPANRIYNAMVAPLVPYAIKGAIWYQGESNRKDKFPMYFNKLEALISGWREDFQVGEFPFYLVQIAPFKYNRKKPGDDTILCKNIWQAQYRAARELTNCGLVPIHDTIHGKITDIHPWDKQPVSERLAQLALKNQYGKSVVVSVPEFKSALRKGNVVEVSFKHVDKGLVTNDQLSPTGFEVAGKDQVFVAATAVLKEDVVEVTSDAVERIEYIRMGWKETLVPNLADKNGWPAFQFGAQKVQ